jgi:hypothetical protein
MKETAVFLSFSLEVLGDLIQVLNTWDKYCPIFFI